MDTRKVQLVGLVTVAVVLLLGSVAVLLVELLQGKPLDLPAGLISLDSVTVAFFFAHGSFSAGSDAVVTLTDRLAAALQASATTAGTTSTASGIVGTATAPTPTPPPSPGPDLFGAAAVRLAGGAGA